MTDLVKLESQSKNKIFRQVQDTVALLSNESIIINDEIISINEKIYDIRKRQLILSKKTEVVRLIFSSVLLNISLIGLNF